MIVTLFAEQASDSSSITTTVAAVVGGGLTVSAAAAAGAAALRSSGENRKQRIEEAKKLECVLAEQADGVQARRKEYGRQIERLEERLGNGFYTESAQMFRMVQQNLSESRYADMEYVASESLRADVAQYRTRLESTSRFNDRLRALSITLVTVGIVVFLVGCGVATFGAFDVGAFGAVCGLVPGIFGGLLFNRADKAEALAANEFEHLKERMNSTTRLRQALAIVGDMKDDAQREYVYSTLALTLALAPSTDSDSSSIIKSALSGRPDFRALERR